MAMNKSKSLLYGIYLLVQGARTQADNPGRAIAGRKNKATKGEGGEWSGRE